MLRIRRILFPTDFSEHAEHAWTYGLSFAKEFGAEVHLLHIVTPPPRLTEAYAVNFDPEALVHALRAEATGTLDRLARVAKDLGLSCHTEIQIGVDFREIIDYAKGHEIDLIVMATHGRTGLAHALLGSVTEKVVRKAPCPVLTIKPPALKTETA
jgi:nucleotide-binding universal stress UspA family protein